MTAFDVRAEVAFNSGFSTPAASRVWTDVTPYMENQNPFTITRGRQDERSAVNPSTLSGLVLDNTDARFTPELATGAYYPNVKRGRPIRVRVRYPATQPGNYATANQASVETSAADWNYNIAFGTYDVPTSVAQTAVRAFSGTKSVLGTWATTVKGHWVGTAVGGLAVGRQYVASVYVYVPAGSPDPQLEVLFVGNSARTSTKDAWVRLSKTFTATATSQFVGIQVASATAGQTCYIDALMVDDATVGLQAFTTSPVPIYDRFTGYVNDWAVAWPEGGDIHATCTVSASSRTARIANAAALRSVITEEYALDSPKAHYQLGEPEGATTAGSVAATAQSILAVAQAGAGGTLAFGAGTGPGTDGLSAPVFTRASAGNGKYLAATLQTPLTAFGDDAIAIDAFFNTSTAATQTVAALWFDSSNYLLLQVDATGKLAAVGVGTDATSAVQTATATTAGSVADGATHHGAIRVVLTDGSPPTAVVSVILDGVATTAASIPWIGWGTTANFQPYSKLIVGGPIWAGGGGSLAGDVFNGTLAHVGVYVVPSGMMTDARFAAHFNAGNNGFAGETAQARIARYAGYVGIPAAEISAETGLLIGVAHVDTTDASALDLMQRVTTSEYGLLFDDRSGALTFHSRSHRYNAASALTLDVAAAEVEADYSPKLDDQGLVNDLTVSRPGGMTTRSIDAASIAENGYYRDTLEVLTTADAEVQDAADWRVAQSSTPRVKASTLSLDLVTFPTAGKIATILGIDLGAKVTTLSLPAQAQASSVDSFVEGAVEVIGIANFDVTWNVSPATGGNVWQLDSATNSQLDSTTVLAY